MGTSEHEPHDADSLGGRSARAVASAVTGDVRLDVGKVLDGAAQLV